MSYWFQTRWFLCEFPIGFYVKLSSAVQPSWSEGGTTGHNFGWGPSKDHSTKVWMQLAQWFLRRRFLCEFPIGSYVKVSSAWGFLGRRAEPPDKFLEENHPMSISSKFSSYSVEEQTRKNSNFPVRGIFKNPREIIVNIFR